MNLKARLHPALYIRFRLMVAHFRSLGTNWAWFKHHDLTIVAHHVLQFKTTVYHLLTDTTPCLKAQIISKCFMKHDKEFTVIKWSHHSPDPGEQIWDVMEQKTHHNKSAATLWGYHVNAERKCQRTSRTSLNLWYEELRQLWRENELQPGTNKSYVKCPLSVIHLEPLPFFFLNSVEDIWL